MVSFKDDRKEDENPEGERIIFKIIRKQFGPRAYERMRTRGTL